MVNNYFYKLGLIFFVLHSLKYITTLHNFYTRWRFQCVNKINFFVCFKNSFPVFHPLPQSNLPPWRHWYSDKLVTYFETKHAPHPTVPFAGLKGELIQEMITISYFIFLISILYYFVYYIIILAVLKMINFNFPQEF